MRKGSKKSIKTETAAGPWVSVEEIAEHLAVKKETVYKLIARKKLPARKVGKQWRFRQVEVDLWVNSGKAAIARDTDEVPARWGSGSRE